MIFRTPAALSSAQGSKIFGLNGYVGEPVLRRDSKRSRYVRHLPIVRASSETPAVLSNINNADKKLHDIKENIAIASESEESYTMQSGAEVFPAEQQSSRQDNRPVKPEASTFSAEKTSVQIKALRSYRKNPLTTKGIFWFMALISIPIVNVAALLICSFKGGINSNYRAVSRAVLIWLLILTTAILAVITALFFMRVPIDITSFYKSIRTYLDRVLL